MTRQHIPRRGPRRRACPSQARAARDWAEADRLRAEIEAAGWKVVDRGTDFALSPAAPPDVDGRRAGPLRLERERAVAARGAADGRRRRSSSSPRTGPTTSPARSPGSRRTRRRPGPRSSSSPTPRRTTRRSARRPRVGRCGADRRSAARVVWTSARLGHGAALNIGLRRATGAGRRRCSTRAWSRPATSSRRSSRALDDPTRRGRRRLGHRLGRPAHVRGRAGRATSTRSRATAMAFRRADAAARGPLDERFRFYRNLDIWWSLVLRDEGEGEPPRRAVARRRPADRRATSIAATRASRTPSATG